jgi:hypothetical protein
MKYILLAVLLFTMPAQAKLEKDYQKETCNGVMEYRLDNGCRVDCLTDEYAIEYDFANKWAEAVGQALYYAEKTGKKPAIVLILKNEQQKKHLPKAEVLCKKYGIELVVIYSLTP